MNANRKIDPIFRLKPCLRREFSLRWEVGAELAFPLLGEGILPLLEGEGRVRS